MSKLLATILVFGIPALFVTRAAQPLNPVGAYGCTGTGIDGKSYTVSLDIQARGDNYILTWSTGNPTAYGFGMVSGDVLSVYFETPGGPGLASYRISKTALTGRWTPLGAEESWPETCTIGGPAQPV